MLRRAALPATVAVAAALVAAGCSTSGTSLSPTQSTLATTTTTALPRGNVDGVLKIGALVPVTGAGAPIGASLLRGISMAVEEINSQGGVNGRPDELITGDEAGDPAMAAVVLDRMVEVDLVDAVIGPASTRVTLSLLGQLTQSNVLSCSPTNTATSLSEYPDQDFYFRTAPPDSLQAVALGRIIAETGARSTAILYVDDDYGRGIADGLAAELRSQGNEVVARVTIDPTAPEYETVLREMLANEPDAIAYAGVGDPGIRVLATLHDLGVKADDVPIFVTDGMRGLDLTAALGGDRRDAMEGVRGMSMAPFRQSATWFSDAFVVNTNASPLLYGAYAYDCVNVIALAAESIRSDDPVQIRGVLPDISKGGVACTNFATCLGPLRAGRNIDLDGASGPLELGARGDPEWGTFDQFRFDAEGQSTTERQLPVRRT